MYDKVGKLTVLMAVCAVACGALFGCDRQEPVDEGRAVPPERGARVDFPAELQPDDPSVVSFMRRVIDTCVEGEYDAFRLLWSAREDPYPRDAFERGWRAVQRVTFVHVKKFRRRAEGDVAYGVRARVELDDSVPEPRRDVVFLIIHEAGQWRLARPPAGLSEQLAGAPGAGSDEADAATQPASQPADPPDRETNAKETSRP
ncbi:MAG: hypothetical protein JXB13_23095 [Phycisphaerae bacterium]|nr:hypothetical protein [Phycisphaerae bacterium]